MSRAALDNREVHIKLALMFATMSGLALAAGQVHAAISVSAVVRPVAKIEVQSANAITIAVTLYASATAVAWMAADTCSAPDQAPEQAKIIPGSGIHHLSFSPEEVQGKNLICLSSSDGVLHTSARLPR